MLIRKRDLSHKVISYDSLICIYIIICVIIHLLQSLSHIVNTTQKPFDSRSHGHLFLIKCYSFVSLHEICLGGIYWFESIDSNRIEWMQMFNINRTHKTHRTKCANRTMKVEKIAHMKNILAIQIDAYKQLAHISNIQHRCDAITHNYSSFNAYWAESKRNHPKRNAKKEPFWRQTIIKLYEKLMLIWLKMVCKCYTFMLLCL